MGFFGDVSLENQPNDDDDDDDDDDDHYYYHYYHYSSYLDDDYVIGRGIFINGGTRKWMLYNWTSQSKMDDNWGYPHFRKPPYGKSGGWIR